MVLDDEEHLRNIEEVLKRLQQNGLRVKPEKCNHLWSTWAINWSAYYDEKGGSHTKVPTPCNVQQLRSFPIIMVNLYPISPHYSIHWINHWRHIVLGSGHRNVRRPFAKLKASCRGTCSGISKKLKLATDGSAYSERPIAYASRNL